MPLSIKLKKFTTASDVPTTSELADGETAINTTDKKIYTRVGSSIIEVANIESRTVSFGGVELSLGGSDSTPAFDLSDATNYPTTSLSGTITNAQLAGSIANSKLSNSGFTLVDDSSTSATISLGETLKIQGTSNEVNTSVSGDTLTVGLPDDVTIGGKITGEQVELANTSTNDSLLITTTEDSSNAGPVVSLKRNSSSPTDADYLGQIKFKGENDNDQEVNYAKISGKIDDASDGTEDGIIEFALITGGSQEIVARFKHDGLFLNTGNTLRFEGDGADAHELTLKAADSLDADRTATLPNATGTVALEGTVTTGSTSITSNLGSRTFETESLDTPVGFITISIGGVNYKLPYYSV